MLDATRLCFVAATHTHRQRSQIYVDWLYLWSIAYFANLSNGIYIILKASLRNVPVIGWGMQFFRFIFLRRNWDADRDALGKSLAYAAERSQTRSSRAGAGADKKRDDNDDDAADAAQAASSRAAPNKLLLLIFPEGTTFTERTVPRSAKFAEKMGYEKTRNVVLPRYMGLLFSLRALAADIDDLYLVVSDLTGHMSCTFRPAAHPHILSLVMNQDFTVGYPGVPAAGYGERYYTLRSVYMQGVPPPAIHVNIIITRVTSPADPEEVDPSTVDASRPPLGRLPPSAKASGQERYAPSEEEKTRFDAWLRKRWAGKDELMESFYKEGDMVGGEFVRKEAAAGGSSAAAAAAAPGEQSEGYQRFVEIPMELRSPVEFGDAFTWGIPAIGAAAAVKLVQSFVGLFR